MIKKPLSIFKNNHLLKKIDAWWYLASRVIILEDTFCIYIYYVVGIVKKFKVGD